MNVAYSWDWRECQRRVQEGLCLGCCEPLPEERSHNMTHCSRNCREKAARAERKARPG